MPACRSSFAQKMRDGHTHLTYYILQRTLGAFHWSYDGLTELKRVQGAGAQRQSAASVGNACPQRQYWFPPTSL